MFAKVLVCSNGSDRAIEAATAAAEIARKFGSQIILLSVYDPSVIPAATMGILRGALQADVSAGRYADDTLGNIEEVTGKVFQEAGIAFTTRRELGHPVDRITAAAHDEKADLIVMGSQGLGGFERMLLGSISEGVLHHAHCPVLIVR